MTTAPPAPPDTDAVAFVAALRLLKAWSGLSYRQLERRAARAGHTLPYSTAATMLGRDRLPREELVAAFVAACGIGPEQAQAWLDARVTIACGGPAPTAPTTPGRRFRPSRRALAAAVAIAGALLAGASGAGAFTDDVEVDRTSASLHLSRS
ncbi:helix-turn-helix domain-containing protein [Streptomyces sp. NPDC048584]|uniref:helix-turn-helix domain-containing protein n=1 Tax=Streptomyces sp. NPDC048584 TaxID=3365573 RepID=UPI0037243190